MSVPGIDIEPTATGVRIRVHPGLCEGWGNCHRWGPEVYPLDEDGYIAIHLAEVPPELARAAWSGADACPAQAITVIGERPVRVSLRPVTSASPASPADDPTGAIGALDGNLTS